MLRQRTNRCVLMAFVSVAACCSSLLLSFWDFKDALLANPEPLEPVSNCVFDPVLGATHCHTGRLYFNGCSTPGCTTVTGVQEQPYAQTYSGNKLYTEEQVTVCLTVAKVTAPDSGRHAGRRLRHRPQQGRGRPDPRHGHARQSDALSPPRAASRADAARRHPRVPQPLQRIHRAGPNLIAHHAGGHTIQSIIHATTRGTHARQCSAAERSARAARPRRHRAVPRPSQRGAATPHALRGSGRRVQQPAGAPPRWA